jgi:hypothetical protein
LCFCVFVVLLFCCFVALFLVLRPEVWPLILE